MAGAWGERRSARGPAGRVRASAGVLALGLTSALALVLGLAAISRQGSPAGAGAFAADDPRLFFSPWTWTRDGSGSQTTHFGASVKFGWTGRNLRLGVDVSMLDRAGVAAEKYPVIGYSIDGRPFEAVRLARGVAELALARDLPGGRHRCVAYLRRLDFGDERWQAGRQVALWRLTGLRLDPGAVPLPYPGLRPKRALFYGDSILSGAYNLGAAGDSRLAWAEVVAERLGAEPGRVGFEAQCYAIAGNAFNGNVPALYDPGDRAGSTWDKLDSAHTRLRRGRFLPRPDYLFLTHGTNDFMSRVPGARVEASVRGLLPRVRRAAGPEAEVFLVVPFEGYPRLAAALGAAFDAYQAATPDRRCHLIDLGPEARPSGVDVSGGRPVRRSFDGIHPDAAMHARLGAMMAERVRRALAGSPSDPDPPPGTAAIGRGRGE